MWEPTPVPDPGVYLIEATPGEGRGEISHLELSPEDLERELEHQRRKREEQLFPFGFAP